MHIQPSSASTRKYIPLAEYYQLMDQQRFHSFIGMPLNQSTEGAIAQRIKDLESLEARGFVYLAEKGWLKAHQDHKTSGEYLNYRHWIAHLFSRYLQIQFDLSPDFEQLEYKIWHAELDARHLLLDYDALKNPAFLPIDELDIFIGGDDHGPWQTHLIRTFEFLHNLEYTIATLRYKPNGNRELSITGIDVSNPTHPGRWELNVISDYGSDWDFTMVDGRAFQWPPTD